MLHAVQNSGKKAHNHSVSPTNYDNGLGYAPKTIRLFNQRHNQPSNVGNTTKIVGKLSNKDNIFYGIASGKGKLKGRTLGRFRQSQQPNISSDYPHITSEPAYLATKYSMPSIAARLGTENSSVASRDNSRSSKMSLGHGSEADKNNSNIM